MMKKAAITLCALCLLCIFLNFSWAQSGGLHLAYSFDEGRGSTADDASGNGNAATLSDTAWTVGRFASGLFFEGNRAYTIRNPVNNFPRTEITAEFSMRTSDVLNRGTPISYAVPLSDNEFRIHNYKDFRVSVKTNQETGPTGVSANDGNWHHIAVTWRSSDG